MEIRIRTADEIAADRVTVEVNGARLYTADEVGDAQAGEAELVATPLRRRIAELQRKLTREVDRADRLENLATEMEDRAEKAERVKSRFNRDRVRTVRAEEMAAQMKNRAERAERELAEMKSRVVTSLDNGWYWGKDTLYTREVVRDLQANEVDLVVTPLKRRVDELEAALALRADVIAELRVQAERAENRVRVTTEKLDKALQELDEQRHRVVANLERAERAEKLAAWLHGPDGPWARTQRVSGDLYTALQKIKELRGEVGGYQESSERCERELTGAHRIIEARDRLLSTATTALRKISQEVTADHGVPGGPVANMSDVIDNVRDLASPWADTSAEDKARRPLYQA